MARRIATGIDIGTHQTKVVVVEEVATPEGSQIHIIGTGMAETAGMRHGYVVDLADATESIVAAKRQAESMAHLPIKAGFLAVGGVSLDEARGSGETIISRADSQITDLDIDKVRDAARRAAEPSFINRKVLHEIPLGWHVDGVKTLGEPLGMRGTKLEGEFLFITCLAQHADHLTTAVENADIEVIDRMASPLAGSYVTLTKDQKVSAWGLYCPGVAGMARGGDPDSANSQFFLMRGPYPSLERQYTAWGRVLSGLDAVRAVKLGEPPADPMDYIEHVRLLADLPEKDRPKIRVIDPKGAWFKAEIARLRTLKGTDFSVCDIEIPVEVK